MKATTMLRCSAWRVIDALTVNRLCQKWRELTVKSPGRNLNRSHRKALRGHWVIGRKAAERRRDGQKEGRCDEGE
jgi:hypothetical protein